MPGSSHLLATCPLCSSRRLRYAFSQEERRATRCADCQLLFLNPQPGPSEQTLESALDKARAERVLAQLVRYCGQQGGRLLLIGPAGSPLQRAAEEAGYHVTAALTPSSAFGEFDLCLLDHALECSSEPLTLLKECRSALRLGGTLALAGSPSIPPSRSFAAEQKHWFDTRTVQTALFFSGFGEVLANQSASLDFHFCRVAPLRQRRLLSVVVPAYNEAGSLAELMEALLVKSLPGLDKEIVLVESNSTDGTREIALGFRDHPLVRVILEDRPRGKGHAVRTGLGSARGDFIMIQDADLEYDLEDYDGLLEPLVTGREAFVLGSRHSGSVWKMRQFSGQASLSALLNLGHTIFTGLVNVLFGQRLKDPFTMFKVFRRDCLFGLRFECNRFDFDYELLIKLILKGYQPVELPVNYRSRSFKQGKKVSLVRDPLTWLRALLKLRLTRIDPLGEIERQRAAQAPASPELSGLAPEYCA